ncbi:M23 family peptidase, partial [Pseudomonas sp. HMWF031]
SLPHLHFGIYVAKFYGKYVSVPFSLDSSPPKASP